MNCGQDSHQSLSPVEVLIGQVQHKFSDLQANSAEEGVASTIAGTGQATQIANVLQQIAQLVLPKAGGRAPGRQCANLTDNAANEDVIAAVSRLVHQSTKIDINQDDTKSDKTKAANSAVGSATGVDYRHGSPARETLQPLGRALLTKFGLSEAEVSTAELHDAHMGKVARILSKCLMGCEPTLDDVVSLAIAFNINLDDSGLVARWHAAHAPAGSIDPAWGGVPQRVMTADEAWLTPPGSARAMLPMRPVPVNLCRTLDSSSATPLSGFSPTQRLDESSRYSTRHALPLEELGRMMLLANQELQLGDQI